MKRRRQQAPPRRLCLDCGGHYYAWSAYSPHQNCPAKNSLNVGPSLRELRNENQERLRHG